MRKGAALIRSEFKIDPWTLTTEEFCDRFTEAAWLQQHRTQLLAQALGFGRSEE